MLLLCSYSVLVLRGITGHDMFHAGGVELGNVVQCATGGCLATYTPPFRFRAKLMARLRQTGPGYRAVL